MLPSRFKRKLITAVVVPALAAPLAVLAAGEQQERQGATQQQSGQMQQSQVSQGEIQLKQDDRRASQLIGMDVRSPQDEKLGDIRDLVIDTQTGKVEYVALAHGGFLGMGEDLYAYPVTAFQPGQQRDQLLLNLTRDQLQQSQGFSNNDWPKVRDDRGFWDRVTSTFGRDQDRQAAAGATTEQSQQFVRASEIKGETVRDQAGTDLGEIEELVVNLDEGEVRYVVLDTSGDYRMVPVRMEDVEVRRDNGNTIVRYTKDTLDLSSAFQRDEWPEALRADSPAAAGATGAGGSEGSTGTR